MEIQTIILRFRDLVTAQDETIKGHQKVLDKKGYVWWGWWNKGNEKTPYKEFSILCGEMRKNPIDVYLMDSGQEKLYKAKCTDIQYSDDKKIPSPNPEFTPNYYNMQEYYAWFQFEKIEECDPKEIRSFSYVHVDALFKEATLNYEKFNCKRIFDLKELIQQNRTVWFVRKFEKEDSDYEIKLLNVDAVEPHHFSKKYYEVHSNQLLWLSDMHFGTKSLFKVKVENSTDVTLTEHIKKAYRNGTKEEIDSFGGLLISGDVTWAGEDAGFDKACEFVADLNRNLVRGLTAENIVVCPGNHDFKRKNIILKKGIPEKVSENPDSIQGYQKFYHSIYHILPNEYMACGRRLLMSSGRTVEIVALNSLILQQYKNFEGHGYLSDEQLDYVAQQMGWREHERTGALRIVMMHHHYLPACLVEAVTVNKASSAVYDAERLMQWLAKYHVKILLHGHKHQSFFRKVGYYDNSSMEIKADQSEDLYVIAMGGTGAAESENKFATLTINYDEVILDFFRIYADGTEAGKRVQTIHLPV